MDFLFSVSHLIKLKYLSVVMLNQMDLSETNSYLEYRSGKMGFLI